MAIKNVGLGIWNVVVSKCVERSPYPVKKKATVRGLKTGAKLKEAELLIELTESKSKDSGSLTVAASVTTFTSSRSPARELHGYGREEDFHKKNLRSSLSVY